MRCEHHQAGGVALLAINTDSSSPHKLDIRAASDRCTMSAEHLQEAAASGAPRKPEITVLDRYTLVQNDAVATKRVGGAFKEYFPAERVQETQPTTASEDFGCFGAEWQVPSVFWFVGGTDPAVYAKAKAEGKIGEIPTNHNPGFAPVIQPTLKAGVEAMVVAAQAWLSA